MSNASDTDLLAVQETLRELPIRVEPRGGGVRFTWQGGDYGLDQLGFAPALPTYVQRGDIPLWLLQRPDKGNIPTAYREIMTACWERRPSKDRLRLREHETAAEAVRVAHEIVTEYQALLGVAASIVSVRRREGLGGGGLIGLWGRSTGYLTGEDPPPEKHPAPTDSDWIETVARDAEPLAGRHRAFVGAVTASAESALITRARALRDSSAVRAREVVVAEFLHALVVAGDGTPRRPPLNSLWT